MIDPRLLQGGFRIGIFVLGLSLITLPFQPRDSAQFVVTVMTVIVSGTFVLGIALVARRAQPRLPNDKRTEKRYTKRSRRRGT